MSRRRTRPPRPCPCGLSDDLSACCGRYLGTGEVPPTPELTMRSRYTAYALRDEAHLRATWHPSTVPDDLALDPALSWTGLEVLEAPEPAPFADRGTVAFRARWSRRGERGTLTERSDFVHEDGRWLYVRGDAARD